MAVTLGADPEVFFEDCDGNPYPAIGLVGGTKEDPRRMAGLPLGFAVQEDNVMAEFNIPYVGSVMAFDTYIMAAMQNIEDLATKNKLKVSRASEVIFASEHLKSPLAHVFGCDPDFDAWNGGEQRRLPLGEASPWRFAGGHIHIGGEFNCPPFVAVLFLEVHMAAMGCLNLSGERAKSYGALGAFRPKPYGIEYRTPDNSWLFSTDIRRRTAKAAIKVGNKLERLSAGTLHGMFQRVPWQRYREAIQKNEGCLPLEYYSELKNHIGTWL